jgi:hypothetical protein
VRLIFYCNAAVAPGAIRVVSNPDQAAVLVTFTLGRLHMIRVCAGALYLLATMALVRSL